MSPSVPCRLLAGLQALALSVALWAAPIESAPPETSDEPGARLREIRALAAKGQTSAPALAAALKDPQPPVRAAAIDLLASVKGRAAVADIAPLVDDAEESVAVTAVRALFDFGGDATLEPLRKALRSRSIRVRTQAASNVGDARDLRFVGDLGALLSDEMPGVRRTAVEALRGLGDPSTFPYLMAATGDKTTAIVVSAIAGLENLKDARSLPRVAQLVGSPTPDIRAAVAHAIATLGGLGTYGAVFTRLARDPDRAVRLAAATGLRDGPSQGAVPQLAAMMADTDGGVRRVAVQALREQEGTAASAALGAATSDKDENVRASAVLALGARRAKDQANVVAALAHDPSDQVREAVASTLGDLGRAEDLMVLKVLAADTAAAVRASAVVAAARIGTEAALPIVDSGAKDPDALVRLETIRALGLLDLPDALERLRQLAVAGDLESRIAAIDRLAERKDKGAIALLRKIAQDPVESLRMAARRALEALGA